MTKAPREDEEIEPWDMTAICIASAVLALWVAIAVPGVWWWWQLARAAWRSL